MAPLAPAIPQHLTKGWPNHKNSGLPPTISAAGGGCLLPTKGQSTSVMPRLILGLLVVMAGAPAIAGAAVGQSIWKQEQAYQRAIKSKPADAKVTGSHCHANYMGMDTVWTCTVMWD